MTLNLNIPVSESHLTPRISVIGVGGAGGNAVNNMIQSNLEGVDFLVANTDAQALSQSLCKQTIQIGRNVTQGLGAGSRPEVGRAAAEESLDDILAALEGVNMVFITAGMGGGTGTGAAPVIARAAREAGILTVGVTTKPFQFEGVHRMRIAETGLGDLQQYVDTLIIIPNQNLFRVANEKTTFADAFKMADDVLHAGVRGVTDLIVMPGLINLDFADIRAVMSEMGKAMMGTGEAEGDNRAIEAAEAAISNPLLDDVSMKGAHGVLINITGGDDLTLFEVDEAANRIRDEVDPDANIIFGSTFETDLKGKMRVSVVATGIDSEDLVALRPVSLSLVSSVGQDAAAGVPAGPAATAEAPEAPVAPVAKPAPDLHGAEPPAAESERLADPRSQSHQNASAAAPAVAAAYEPDDRFVAPPPMEAPPGPVEPPASRMAEADAFAAADLVNSVRREPPRTDPKADAPSRKKGRTLFDKVTGAARAFHEATQASSLSALVQRAPEEPRPSSVTPGAQGRGGADAASEAGLRRPPMGRETADQETAGQETAGQETAPRSPVHREMPGPAAATGQARLTGLDPSDRLKPSLNDEALLDIPAFLRRQAN